MFRPLTGHDQVVHPSVICSSSSSVGAAACCGLWPVEQYLSNCPYLSPTLSIFSLPTLEDLFPLLLSIFSWVFLFVSSLPVLEWRSFWASYPPPFCPGDPANLSFAPLSILLYFLLYSTLTVLNLTLLYLLHDRANWCSPSFSSTTLQLQAM